MFEIGLYFFFALHLLPYKSPFPNYFLSMGSFGRSQFFRALFEEWTFFLSKIELRSSSWRDRVTFSSSPLPPHSV